MISMSFMRALLEKLIDEKPEGVEAIECQVSFKTSSYIPTPKGPMASTMAAGALMRSPVDGVFCLLTKGENPARETIIVEVFFEADQIARLERIKGVVEAPRIMPVGGLIPGRG